MGGSTSKFHQYAISSTFIHDSLLDEIFQHVDLLKLLVIRRVCRQWHSLVSREAALYQRQVAIQMYQVSNQSFQSQEELENNFWQYARWATTLLLFEDPRKKVKTVSYHDGWYVTAILRLYTVQARADERTHLLGRFVFANTTLREDDFRIPAIYRSDIFVTLRKSRIMVRMDSVFGNPIPQAPAAMHHWATQFLRESFIVKLLSSGNCRLITVTVRVAQADPEATQRWLETPDLVDVFDHLPNPTASYLLWYCKRKITYDTQLRKLSEFRSSFLFVQELCDFVEHLITKFSPGSEGLVNVFWAGDIKEFCQDVYPLVLHFLLQFRKVVKTSPHVSCTETRQKNKITQPSS